MIKKFHENIFRSSVVYLVATFLLALTLNACGPVTAIAPTPTAVSTPLQEAINYFRNFKVISDEPGGLVFSVDYNYDGSKGDVRYGAGCLDKGVDISCVETDSAHFQPYHGASKGTLTFRLGLYGPDTGTTNQIYVGLYVWESGELIVYQPFDYIKHWDVVLPTPTLVPTMIP